MGQQNIAVRANVTYVGIESTYGTLSGALLRDQPLNETVDVSGLAQTEAENNDARSSLFDHLARIRGYKSGSKVKLKHQLKAPSAQLTSGATPATSVLGTYLKALMGGESSAAGSTVATATSQTSIVTAAADGVKFPAGTWLLNGVAGVLEPVRVSNRATDTLTYSLGLSAASAASQLLVNMYVYYPTQTNGQSLSLQFGYVTQDTGSTDAQWQCTGCTGDFGFDFARDKIAAC